MELHGRANAMDIIYFNHNNIYNEYESLWLSSTWPIKVLLQGDLTMVENKKMLNTTASFLIENGITEYVRDEMVLANNTPKSFIRKTYVRTSKDNGEKWLYQMLEEAKRINWC